MEPSQVKRISVLVPSYNHAKFIEKCLRSIVGQSRYPDELLVVDDGSNDDSPSIIENILKDAPFPTELVVNKNHGLCATLNEGLKRTSGDYFAYLGSDDLWLPGFLERRFALLESRPKAVLGYGHGYLIDEDDQIFESSSDWKNFEFPDGDARPMLYMGTAPLSPTVFYRRSFLEKIGWNERSKLEDYELYLQLAENGEFAFDPTILAAWRRHDRNTSRDLDFMLDEVLAAQGRVSEKLNWSRSKTAVVKKRTSFFFSEEYDRAGNKREARKLLFPNMGGAPSTKILMRALIRNMIPTFILERRKAAIKKAKISEYGTVLNSNAHRH